METDTLMSIIAIIVGIIIMAFPYFGVAATSVIFGLGFIIWGVITLLYSYMLERITGPFRNNYRNLDDNIRCGFNLQS